MKKTILTATALLCLSTPLQAFDLPCTALDVPCYVKSNTTILRKEPSEDSPIMQQLSPARDSDKLYFYLRAKIEVKRKWWGYFEPVEPIVDMITGKKMAGGWTPLDNAFHDLDYSSFAPFLRKEGKEVVLFTNETVAIAVCKPKTYVILVDTEYFFGLFGVDAGLSVFKLEEFEKKASSPYT